MNYDKVVKIVKTELREYSLYNEKIKELELKKIKGVEKDINSSIQGKNRISSKTESEAINNIVIDEKIEKVKKWKKIIDNILVEIKQEDSERYIVLNNRYVAHLPGCYVSVRTGVPLSAVRRYIEEFIIEIAMISINEGLIKIEKIC